MRMMPRATPSAMRGWGVREQVSGIACLVGVQTAAQTMVT